MAVMKIFSLHEKKCRVGLAMDQNKYPLLAGFLIHNKANPPVCSCNENIFMFIAYGCL